MPQLSERFAAYRAGYQAYLSGKKIKDAPPDTHRPMWTRGYAAARTDRARLNRQLLEEERKDQ